MVKAQELEILELQNNLMLKACSIYKNLCKSVDDMARAHTFLGGKPLRPGLNRIWIDLSVSVDVRDN
jgi:hypothetical protein